MTLRELIAYASEENGNEHLLDLELVVDVGRDPRIDFVERVEVVYCMQPDDWGDGYDASYEPSDEAKRCLRLGAYPLG